MAYPLFLLGQVIATGGTMGIGDLSLLNRCLNRHMLGDWLCICEEDAKINSEAVRRDGASCPLILSPLNICKKPGTGIEELAALTVSQG
ncbi:hypothetical protein [Nitrosospira multiformis]|nr:hypothetical protein [Nitrosospira multiformis]